ncbi:MAG TPA: D-glycerate dehydrogenase [Solirubrobacterales bacterium]|nr:D-glycerate dehydrogenase [Solirubrobacterales bacterium]
MPTFAVLHPLPEPALQLLRAAGEVRMGESTGPLSESELEALVRGADAVLALPTDRIDGCLLDAAGSGLRVVANVAVGYDNVDVSELASRGVVVTNTPSVLVDATADLAIALMLAVTRRVGEGERLIRRGTAWSWSLDFMLGHSLRGRTLGIIGFGEIGRATAGRARAFGMEVAYFSRSAAEPAVEAELGARRLELDELLECADVVSLHCPLTAATRHLIDTAALARMRESAYLVNTARGAIVDEAALVEALDSGAVAGAALDVYEQEPRVDPRLVEMENVVLLPHLGSATVETREEMALLAARNAIAVVEGRPPLTPVTVPGAPG